jgi:hypothetical protein
LFEAPNDALIATIQFKSASPITGRFVDGTGDSIITNVAVRGIASFDLVLESEAGVFQVLAPKGEATELWYGLTNQFHSIDITADQTEQALDLGDIVVNETEKDGLCQISVIDVEEIREPTKIQLARAVTLVALDDAEVHCFRIDGDGRAYFLGEDGEAIHNLATPSGTYFVVPGSFRNLSFFALVDAVKQGRQGKLVAANVPTITVEENGVAQFQLDAQAAHDAVMSVGGDLVSP